MKLLSDNDVKNVVMKLKNREMLLDLVDALPEATVGTGQTITEMLEELYSWSWKMGRKARESGNAYKIGKADGAIEALESVILQVMGGQKLFELWEKEYDREALLSDVGAYVKEHYDGKEEEELPLES